MKVEVLTVDDVAINRFAWFSKWIDIAVFDYECRPWLLQMRISRSNTKQFRATSITGRFYKQATSHAIGDLTHINKKEPQ